MNYYITEALFFLAIVAVLGVEFWFFWRLLRPRNKGD